MKIAEVKFPIVSLPAWWMDADKIGGVGKKRKSEDDGNALTLLNDESTTHIRKSDVAGGNAEDIALSVPDLGLTNASDFYKVEEVSTFKAGQTTYDYYEFGPDTFRKYSYLKKIFSTTEKCDDETTVSYFQTGNETVSYTHLTLPTT